VAAGRGSGRSSVCAHRGAGGARRRIVTTLLPLLSSSGLHVCAVWVSLCWPVRATGRLVYICTPEHRASRWGRRGGGRGMAWGLRTVPRPHTRHDPFLTRSCLPQPWECRGSRGRVRPCWAPFAPAPGCRARDLPWPASRLLRAAADTPPCRQGVLHCTPVGSREATSRGARVEVRSRPHSLFCRCSAVVASVSGGRHEDLLASRHGDGWRRSYITALHPHTRRLVRSHQRDIPTTAPKATTSLSLIMCVRAQEAQHGAALQPHHKRSHHVDGRSSRGTHHPQLQPCRRVLVSGCVGSWCGMLGRAVLAWCE
jgi:hypothetical protein